MMKKTRLSKGVLLWFNFCFFMLGFSEGIDTHVSLPCFFLICAIAALIIYFDLRLTTCLVESQFLSCITAFPFLKYYCKCFC